MAISFNYKDLEYITPGVYEAVIQNTSEEFTPGNGTRFMAVSMVIRNDVQQQCQDKRIEYRIWTTSRPKTKTIEGYVEYSLALMSKACRLPEQIDVNSVNELSKLWIGKPVRITVRQKEHEGNTYIEISKVEESGYIQVNHKYKSANNNNNNTFIPNNNNDNIPF